MLPVSYEVIKPPGRRETHISAILAAHLRSFNAQFGRRMRRMRREDEQKQKRRKIPKIGCELNLMRAPPAPVGTQPQFENSQTLSSHSLRLPLLSTLVRSFIHSFFHVDRSHSTSCSLSFSSFNSTSAHLLSLPLRATSTLHQGKKSIDGDIQKTPCE